MTIQVQPEVFLHLSHCHLRYGESKQQQQAPVCSSWPISPSPATVLKESSSFEDLACDDDTLSTASLSDCGSEETSLRTVSFAEDLVTEVHTRPFTPAEEVEALYYSQEETSRFRQDYRLERKMLNGESLFDAATDSPRRSISRVVVHDGDAAAVYDCEDDFDTPEFWSGSITWW